MYNIKMKQQPDNLLEPIDMLSNDMADQCFQQYHLGKPCQTFYINCGVGESSLIVMWYDDESKQFRLSTENKTSLKQLNDTVKVKKIKNISMSVEIS